MMDYAVVVMKLSLNDGGGYLALVPDLYGCMSDGDTPEEAVVNAKSAIADWIETSVELGREVPLPGSAAKKVKAREAALIDAIKIISEQYDGLDSRIDRLFGEIEHIKELIENQEAWSRFEGILHVERKVTKVALLPC